MYLQDATGGGNIQGVVGNLTSQQTVLFNATIADFSQNPPGLAATSQLIVNIPKEWTFNGPVTLYSANFGSVIGTKFADNSTQIVGTLGTELDNGEAWFQFSATAPGNTSGNAKMYVFHILGTGLSTGGDPYLIGPVTETIVQVCPTSGGPTGCP